MIFLITYSRYRTLHHLGKGAFGCVRSAYRLADGLLVVTKFIVKSKVLVDSWLDGDDATGENQKKSIKNNK